MVNFNDDNPAIEAYRRGQQAAQQTAQADASLESSRLQNTEARLAMPSKLRSITAGADTAVANAQVARETAPYQITQQRERAAQAPIATQSAQVGLDQQRVEAPLRTNLLRTQVSTANYGNIAAKVAGFHKSLELANAGDLEGARYVAQQYGETFPENVLTDARLRGQITNIANEAQARYPQNPQKQQQYIAAAMKGLSDATLGEGNAGNPMYPYQVPNAPEADASSGRSGGGVFQFRRQAWLDTHPGDEQGALAYASGTKQQSDAEIYNMASGIMAREFQGAFNASAEEKQARTQEIYQQLKGMGPTGAQPQPQPQPMPQPAPQPQMPPNLQHLQGLQYSPSRQQYRDPVSGAVYDINGNPVQ